MIYFMQAVDGGAVKIGQSDDVEYRKSQLEAIYGRSLIILATMVGGRDEEISVHAQFAHLRLGKTEQFRPEADLMDFIGCPLLVEPNAEAVEAMPMKPLTCPCFTMKGDPEWVEWVDEFADFLKVTKASLVDRALVELARFVGFKRPAPPRFKAK